MFMEKLKNYIFFIIYIFLNPHLIFVHLRGIYLPVYIQFEWLEKYNIKTVVDVGTYHGHVSKSLHHLFPNAKIFMFDPIDENIQIILKSLKSKNIIINKIAHSNKTGKTTFYINDYIPSSSILEVEKESQKKFPYMAKMCKVNVKTTTLDSYFKNKKLEDMIFLKMDTQGAEKFILNGGKQFLKNVSIIHIETFFDSMYKNQGLFNDIYDILVKLGFKYMSTAKEAQFYPTFDLEPITNSIFINTNIND